jgi:hypothetical protein
MFLISDRGRKIINHKPHQSTRFGKTAYSTPS